MRRVALAVLTLLAAGCGPGGGPEPAPPCRAAPDPAALAWLGDKPADPEAGAAYDGAHRLLETAKDEEEFRQIGLLAFYPETLPALLNFMEKGCDLQVRAAFNGLRGVLDGTMSIYYLRENQDRAAYRAKVLPWLRAEANRTRIASALVRLPEPSRKQFAPMVAALAEAK